MVIAGATIGLTACQALPSLGQVFNAVPAPVNAPGDPLATVQAILTATAAGWTATSPPSATLPPSLTPLPTTTPSPGSEAAPRPTETPFPTFTITAFDLPINVGPSYFAAGINPLTGLTVVDSTLLERRPLAIKIANYPRRVRPQSGLSLADIVFEYYIELGATRFISVFYGNNASWVGPIRSGRFFDEHVVRMYDALFAFASADDRVLETWLESDLLTRLIMPQTGGCPPLCRDPQNPDYNNLYAITEYIAPYAQTNGATNDRPELHGMRFQSLVPWGGEPATDVFVRYSRLVYTHWQYDPAAGLYGRFQDSSDDNGDGEQYLALMDELTGAQVSAANVVILIVSHEEFVKTSDTEIVKIHLQGVGSAYVFRDGQVYPATWVRSATSEPLQIYRAGPGSTLYPLKPGPTFFQVVGLTTTIEEDGTSWRFKFGIP